MGWKREGSNDADDADGLKKRSTLSCSWV